MCIRDSSQIVHLFENNGPIAVAVESAPDPTNKFDGSTGTTEGFYKLSLEFKLGSFMVNGIDQVLGASPDGTFIEDFIGYKFIGGDDVLLGGVPADGWGLDYSAHAPGGITHIFGGAGTVTLPTFVLVSTAKHLTLLFGSKLQLKVSV